MVGAVLRTWSWDPSILVGIAALAGLYGLELKRTRRRYEADATRRWRVVSFGAGLLVLALALVSPLDALADFYLFSAHMLQHVLLLLVVPSLLLLGLPRSSVTLVEQLAPAGSLRQKLTGPLPALLAYSALMWAWHAPVLYEAALGDARIHVVEHLCFLGSATLFWWPICRPESSFAALPELLQIVYLFGAALSSTLLAAILTFASSVLYPTYALGPPYSAVRDALGISPLVDQQVGGLLMWVGSAIWFLGAAWIILFRWFEGPDRDEPDATDSLHLRVVTE